jgi:hypothetical protein
VVGGLIVPRKAIWLDRVVDESLIDALKVGEALRPLIDFRNMRQDIMDVQFRRPSGITSRASLYAGLTRILDVDVHTLKGKAPKYRFFIEHETHRRAAPNWKSWASWQPLDRLMDVWPKVEHYLLEREQWFGAKKEAAHHVIEGRVHAAMCRDSVTSYRVINREASPSFSSTLTKKEICGRIRGEIRRVLDDVAEPKKRLRYQEFGTSPDILAVDLTGRLIVVEAKPPGSKSGIVKGPIQARFYAGLIARWLEHDADAPQVLAKMLGQRVAAGLDRGATASFRSDMPVVPVLAVGPGDVSPKRLVHALELRTALARLRASEAGVTEAIEIWRLRSDGDVDEKL